MEKNMEHGVRTRVVFIGAYRVQVVLGVPENQMSFLEDSS